MDMHSKNQYLQTLIQKHGYHLLSKKEKSRLLDEYCKNSGQNRKYAIRKIRQGKYLVGIAAKASGRKRQRRSYYSGEFNSALVAIWRIFDYPCGQRLVSILRAETDRLRQLGELVCSDETAQKLKIVSFRTIDEKLKHQKQAEYLKRKYHYKIHPLLYRKIPVRYSFEQDRNILGNIQIDLVEHCGQTTAGEYLYTLSVTDLHTGWWEGEAVLGKGQFRICQSLDRARKRFPFAWREIHSDNDSGFINNHLFKYTQQAGLGFSRSRPNHKNDNFLVEQKNWTHIKKFVGYLRYDSPAEQTILNNLYLNELRLYKNFFQPTMKLKSKERIGGRIHRKYETAKTPYQKTMELPEVPQTTKQKLEQTYNCLNPAELKREIDRKLLLLYQAYQQKKNPEQIPVTYKKLSPATVTFLNCLTRAISVT